MSATSLTRSGLTDWLIQRFSALVILAFVLFMVGFFVFYGGAPTYSQWHELFHSHWMRIFTLVSAVALAGHIWIGIWTVLTDYVKNAFLRLLLLAFLALGIFAELVWIVFVLWQAR